MDLVRVLATLRDETKEFDWDDAWEKLNVIDATLRSELPLLRGALGDSSALLRLFALKAIARIGGDLDELIPDVVVLLKDRDQDVRAEATKLLRRFGHNRTSLVIPALCQLAKDKNGYLTVRVRALIAVIKLKRHSRHG
jgi:HEAT repeat protein